MKLGIVIFPSKELQDVANSYRKRYDPHYKLISPHLTLKESFEASEDQLPDIVSELRTIASTSKPFSLEFNKVSHFHPTNNVIYYAVQDDKDLTELSEKVYAPAILQHERQYTFVPHVTIGQNMPDDELHDIYSRLRMESYTFLEKVEQFHLVHRLDNLTWSIQQTFTLGDDY
jgi:2'-5' RNA ligase